MLHAIPKSAIKELETVHDQAESDGDFVAEHLVVRKFLNKWHRHEVELEEKPKLIVATLHNIYAELEKLFK